jgi:hypothetical protein
MIVYQVACSDLPVKGRTKDAQFTTQSTSLLITNTAKYSSTRFQQSEDLHPTKNMSQTTIMTTMHPYISI